MSNTFSAARVDVYSYCMLSQPVSPVKAQAFRAAYCTWTRGDKFFCLLATPAYNVIHTTELNGGYERTSIITSTGDDGNTKREDVDVENMQREEEKGRERKRSEGAAGCWAGGSKYCPVAVYRKQRSCAELDTVKTEYNNPACACF